MRRRVPQVGHELRQVIRRLRVVEVGPTRPSFRLEICERPATVPAFDDALERKDHYAQQRQYDLSHNMHVLVLLLSRKDEIEVPARPFREALGFVTARHALRRSGPCQGVGKVIW